jgi:hypothetical protein
MTFAACHSSYVGGGGSLCGGAGTGCHRLAVGGVNASGSPECPRDGATQPNAKTLVNAGRMALRICRLAARVTHRRRPASAL